MEDGVSGVERESGLIWVDVVGLDVEMAFGAAYKEVGVINIGRIIIYVMDC